MGMIETVKYSYICKGQNIGTIILGHLSFAKEPDYHTIISCIATGNPGSVRIHDKFEFEQAGLLKEAGKKFDHKTTQ